MRSNVHREPNRFVKPNELDGHMTNRLKEMGETASWRLMVNAAIKGAQEQGYDLKRLPGRGLSSMYRASKDGGEHVVSIRTTRDRWIAFQPLAEGTRWKTLEDADLVLVSAVDDRLNPQNVDVYLFPADEVRKRFNASYSARIENGHVVRENFGMWVTIDGGDDQVPSQVGHGLANDYPAIARFSIDELEGEAIDRSSPDDMREEHPVPAVSLGHEAFPPRLDLGTVADVLRFARDRISALTGMPADAIKLDLKMGV